MGDFVVRPIGVIRSALKDPADAPKQGALTDQEAEVVVDPAYLSALDGLEKRGKIIVVCWMHGADRDRLKVHPRGQEERRERGVFSTRSPHPDGRDQRQMTHDSDWADWFPHPSPDGRWVVFLSYDRSVKGHPFGKDVVLRLMPLAGGDPVIVARLFGGQGTINVPSWSPDSRQLAFVSYRLVRP